MNSDKLIGYLKRFRQLERDYENYDYNMSVLARDMRGEYPMGESGDSRFAKFMSVEFGMNEPRIREMLIRAASVKVVGDPVVWLKFGGFKAIRRVEFLSRVEQIAVVQAAKASAKPICTVMRERGHVPELRRNLRGADAFAITEATALATFISDCMAGRANVKMPPKNIAAIVRRLASKAKTLHAVAA